MERLFSTFYSCSKEVGLLDRMMLMTKEPKDFDFLDFGSSKSGCIDFAKKRLGGKRGLGIDNNPVKVDEARKAGYDCVVGDITALDFQNDVVRFVTMSHVLEHLLDLNAVREVISCAAKVATDFLFIQGPWFDADQYLRSYGLKLYWSDWHCHPCHLTTKQLQEILHGLDLDDHVIMARIPIVDSADPAIHPITSPRGQHSYDPAVHPEKPNDVVFDIKIYREMVCYVRLRPLLSNWDRLIKARPSCVRICPKQR